MACFVGLMRGGPPRRHSMSTDSEIDLDLSRQRKGPRGILFVLLGVFWIDEISVSLNCSENFIGACSNELFARLDLGYTQELPWGTPGREILTRIVSCQRKLQSYGGLKLVQHHRFGLHWTQFALGAQYAPDRSIGLNHKNSN
jgi:hypothetical protein